MDIETPEAAPARDAASIIQRATETLQRTRMLIEQSRALLENATAEVVEAEKSTHTMTDVQHGGE